MYVRTTLKSATRIVARSRSSRSRSGKRAPSARGAKVPYVTPLNSKRWPPTAKNFPSTSTWPVDGEAEGSNRRGRARRASPWLGPLTHPGRVPPGGEVPLCRRCRTLLNRSRTHPCVPFSNPHYSSGQSCIHSKTPGSPAYSKRWFNPVTVSNFPGYGSSRRRGLKASTWTTQKATGPRPKANECRARAVRRSRRRYVHSRWEPRSCQPRPPAAGALVADFPAPAEGIVLTHFIVSADVPRSAASTRRARRRGGGWRASRPSLTGRQQLGDHQRRQQPDRGQARRSCSTCRRPKPRQQPSSTSGSPTSRRV